MTDTQELSALADQHLPPDVAARWKSLLQPAVQFDWAAGSDPVAAQLGGDPELPVGHAWPEWDGHGPLTFIAAFECAGLRVPGLPLPEDGRLLFFYFDGQVEGAAVGALSPGTQGGARVLYLPPGSPVEARQAPAPIKPYPRQMLRAGAVTTAPEPDSARIAAAFGDRAARGTGHPLDADAFTEAVYEELSVSVCHQVGGFPLSVQWPVEYEAAAAAGELPGAAERPEYAEADRWLLLAQIDSDDASSMMWGESGTLYWLVQEPDLAARRFDRAVFTWQCA
ncbi:YwqG family protein [Glycomyces arizonensis]|uniref:YwqG family protein n=1 Tax=Glycomyces arizonensis TaxID=256035 RepID=UPI0003FB26B2|nr:YwqG family protein [Glycomyces arizonensis]